MKHFNVSQNLPIQSFIPLCLKNEIQFKDFQEILKLFELHCVNVDDLYEEFCSVKDILHLKVSFAGNVNEKWVSVFNYVKLQSISVPNLEKIMKFVLSIPGSNAHTERIFSLMNNK